MSKLITNTIRHTGGSADNNTLDNSQNVTLEGNTTIAANKDLRFTNGSWTGEVAGKIQQNSNKLYIQGGTGGWQFRSSGGSAVVEIATDLTVSTGNLVIGTNGKGIDFSATQNGQGGSSQLLDDYEEGTYNPSWGGVTNTANYNDWLYRKVGGLVYVTGRFKCATTTNNGTTVHGTVPFTPAGNPTNGYNTSVGTVMHKEMNTYSSGNFTSYLSTNTNLYFYKCQQNGDWDSLGSDDVAVNDEMIVSLTYMTS